MTENTRTLIGIWWRAFSIVAVTAINVVNVSRGHYLAAFISGGTLSWIWWLNTRTAVRSELKGGQAAYALGAACGTVVGMLIGRVLG